MLQLLSRCLAAVTDTVRAFARARTASAAVEFAVVLPVAIGLYLGAAEVSQGVMTSRKVNLLTRTITDLLSQQSTSQQATSTPTPSNAVTAAQLSTLMNAAQVLLAPQPTTTLKMTLSAVDITANSSGVCCVAKVRWSYTQGGTLRPCNVTLTVGPDGQTDSPTTISSSVMPVGSILVAPISVLIADVDYTFQPILQTSYFPFAPTFSRVEYMFPRSPGQVVTGALPSSGTQYGKVCY